MDTTNIVDLLPTQNLVNDFDWSKVAPLYAAFTGVLAGFVFTSLAWVSHDLRIEG